MQNENPLRAEKRRKLNLLREAGINPYPYTFDRTAAVGNLITEFAQALQPGEKKPEQSYRIAGRLMTLRSMGKASFFNIQDQTGTVQVYVKVEDLTETDRKMFDLVDLGDVIGIEGFVFKSQKGEFSIYCKSFQILTKSIEPLPEKFHGIQDVEIKYRHRHLDLMTSPESRKVFEVRSKIIKEIRRFLDDRGFLEVETPILQPIYGGAAATPFTTHHKALDMKLYLKISPELYLKRLIVGGFEKVYEITKCFRNEGIDKTHNPEFTLLEFYEAYTDYNYQMAQFEELVSSLVFKIHGKYQIEFQGKEIDFKPPWRRLRVFDGVKEYAGVDPDKATDQEIFAACKKFGSDLEKPASRGEMIMELFELTVEEHLWQPTMVMDHPVEISPLTKIHREDKRLVERFEPFAACMEIGNSYSELNDPEDQLARLKEQESHRKEDAEAHPMDEDFCLAIDAGMPPTGGVGVGIERLVMLLTDQASIRDILFFPTMRITVDK